MLFAASRKVRDSPVGFSPLSVRESKQKRHNVGCVINVCIKARNGNVVLACCDVMTIIPN